METGGQILGGINTAANVLNLLGPQSPLVTGNPLQAAQQISSVSQGVNNLFNPPTPPPQIFDPDAFNNVPLSEIRALPSPVRTALLGQLIGEAKGPKTPTR
jgi:hypothetical protein